jgi:hypothetical protein
MMNIGPACAQNESPRTAPQLEQLVAPIALYPDALLSQVLMASTYPLEVVAAARWVQANPGVTGKALEDAMQKQSWDPSVKALTAVPQTLQMMNDKLDWTRNLGDAFLAQQANVLDAVQRLRQRADDAGNLKTTEQQRVVKTAAPAGGAPPATVYTIESVNPNEYYVPIYDPGVVYGAWPYPAYAPFYWYPPGWVGRGVLAFATGVVVGAAIWGGIDWWRRRVDINVNRYNSFNRTNIVNRNWTHNPAHRGAVPYRDRNVAQRFGRPGHHAAREAYRGTADAGRRELARPGARNVGEKPRQTARPSQGAGNRHIAEHRGANRQQAPRRHASAPRPQAPRRHASAPRPQAPRRHASAPRPQAPRRQVSAPVHRHVSRRAGPARAMAGRGRRSDIRLKHDITLLGRLDNGLGFYSFVYNGEEKRYVGVMAQEVRLVKPEAVVRGRDGYLRVLYHKLGLRFQTYEQWISSGGSRAGPPTLRGARPD